MLKGIDPVVTADLLYVLMRMGHGDDILLCDINHPAVTIASETTHGKLLDLAGCDLPRATEALLSLMPLDTFVEAPVMRMQVVGDPDGIVPIHVTMQNLLYRLEGRPVPMLALERFEFYAVAKRAFAVVRTSDAGPYGCFMFRKGVI